MCTPSFRNANAKKAGLPLITAASSTPDTMSHLKALQKEVVGGFLRNNMSFHHEVYVWHTSDQHITVLTAKNVPFRVDGMGPSPNFPKLTLSTNS